MSGTAVGDSQIEAIADGDSPVAAFHRDGQTFLTWLEDTSIEGEQYHVYRHTEQITAENLSRAEQLTSRWGPLDDDTSRHRMGGDSVPDNFVIHDQGDALSDDVGLFVYTTQEDDGQSAYYAVTIVVDGQEVVQPNAILSLTDSVAENASDTCAVLVRSVNGGLGQVFTQFMDYSSWNPTFQGYAYNYAVALPEGYDASKEYPLKLELHAYSESHKFRDATEANWPAIQVFVDDSAIPSESLHTWWYGFAADHNYQTDGPIPTSGVIENFTEQRVMKALDEVSNLYAVDESRIHARGHSMGASGALSLGIRYGDVFSGIYASQAMTDYQASPEFMDEFIRVWGRPEDNLQIRNAGLHSDGIVRYGVDGDRPTGVWDWMDHGQQVQRRRGEDMAFLMFGHGKEDRVIDWETQGQPFVSQIEAAGVGYSALLAGGLDHAWMGFDAAVHTLFSGGFEATGYGDLGDWVFDGSEPYLALSNGSQSGDLNPGNFGTDRYNLTLDWSTASNQFHRPIVDQPERFEVTLRSLTDSQTVGVTPRQMQQFNVNPGAQLRWFNVDNASGNVIQQGDAFVDQQGLFTVRDFTVGPGNGNRLILSIESNPDVSFEPDTQTNSGNNGNSSNQSDPQTDNLADDQNFNDTDTGANTGNSNEDDFLESSSVSLSDLSSGAQEDNSSTVDSGNQRQPLGSSTVVDSEIFGTATGEIISGSDNNDAIFARGGDDEIDASNGSNIINGGSGNDTLTFHDGVREDYDVGRNSDGLVVVRGTGTDGRPVMNTLIGVERILFSNSVILAADVTDSIIGQTVNPEDSEIVFEDTGGRVFEGTNGNEWLSGSDSDDLLRGFGGDDELHAPIGNNTLDGGDGFDTLVVYEGVRSNFDVERHADNRVTVRGPGVDGQLVLNTLTNIERIVFNDDVLILSDLPVV